MSVLYTGIDSAELYCENPDRVLSKENRAQLMALTCSELLQECYTLGHSN